MHRRLIAIAVLLFCALMTWATFHFSAVWHIQQPTRAMRYPSAEDLAPFANRRATVPLPESLADQEASIQEAWLELANAEYFIFQPLATHNQPTTPHIGSYQHLANKSSSGDIFLSLYEHGTEEGKLYALCGLIVSGGHPDRLKIQTELATRDPEVLVFTLQGLKLYGANRIINNTTMGTAYPRNLLRYTGIAPTGKGIPMWSSFPIDIARDELPYSLFLMVVDWENTHMADMFDENQWNHGPSTFGTGIDLLTGEDLDMGHNGTWYWYYSPVSVPKRSVE